MKRKSLGLLLVGVLLLTSMVVVGSSGPAPAAASPATLMWVGGAPVLGPGPVGAWDASQVGANSVLRHKVIIGTETYHYEMWYTGMGADGKPKIGYAYSKDGLSWVKHPTANPVLSGRSGFWDAGAVGLPFVLFEDGTYKMWYTGSATFSINLATGQVDFASPKIGYAYSSDGINWTRLVNPLTISSPETWDDGGVVGPWVLKQVAQYKMVFTARALGAQGLDGLSIGGALSSDGLTWATPTQQLTKGASGSWDERGVATPALWVDSDGVLQMNYTGFKGALSTLATRVGQAALINNVWTKTTSPILVPGVGGSWDLAHIDHPRPFCGTPFLCGGRFFLFYSGLDRLFLAGVLEVGTTKIGYVQAPLSAQVKVTLQGRTIDSASTTTFSVSLYLPQEKQLVGPPVPVTATRVDSLGTGQASLAVGSYDMGVKGSRSLSEVLSAVWQGTAVVVGDPLREGDADGNDLIRIADFSILATTYGKDVGQAGYDTRADFNEDGRIRIGDFSLLATNYGQNGDIYNLKL